MYDIAFCSDSHNKPQNLKGFIEKTEDIKYHGFCGDIATTYCTANVGLSIRILKGESWNAICQANSAFDFIVGGNHDLSVVYEDIRDKLLCSRAEKKRQEKNIIEADAYWKACDIARSLEENLSGEQKDFIKSMPQRLDFEKNGMNIAMSHDIFAPQKIIEAQTRSEAFSTRIIDPLRALINFEYLKKQNADVGIFGHTHAQTIAEYDDGEVTLFKHIRKNSEFDFKDGAIYLINPGSLSETAEYVYENGKWKMPERDKNKTSHCLLDTENKKVKFVVNWVT